MLKKTTFFALLIVGSSSFGILVASSIGDSHSDAADQQPDSLERRFTTQVKPFLESYCYGCHGSTKPKAMLDLVKDATMPAIVKNIAHWEHVLTRVEAKEMPPEDTKKQPKADERAAVVAWLREVRDREAERNAGGPGIVLARRLSNAEYDYTIRDLTGVDLKPTREFPVDPANEAGFDNTGESLTIGERRTKDLGGNPVQTLATFPDAKDRRGLDGLRAYLKEKRQGDFVDNFCKKLYSYALSRSLLLSDPKSLDAMKAKLIADDYRFGSLVESIVMSPQFLHKRGRNVD